MSDRECTYVVTEYDLTIGTTPVEILPSDPDRVAVFFTISSSTAVYVGLSPVIAINTGIYISAPAAARVFNDNDMPGVAGQKWFAVAAGAGAGLTALVVKRLYV
jgi:hypothetical protein